MIKISIDGLFAPTLERGIQRDALADLNGSLTKAHESLMARREDDLGFYDAPLAPDLAKSIQVEAKRLRALADDLLVLGIGGSSLGGQTLADGLAQVSDRSVRLHFVDNVDPDTLAYLLDRLDPSRTAAVVITKSGGTVETLAQLLIIRRWFRASGGEGDVHSRMTFVTDPEKGLLRDLANSEGIRSFDVPPNVGGRFTALTAVGLLPCAFAGLDIEKVIAGAIDMRERVLEGDPDKNPAMQFAAGAILAQRELGANTLVMMPYSDALRTLSAWFVQLWAESLGKRVDISGKEVRSGQTPLPAVGATDQHAQVQLFVEGPRDKVVTIIEVEQARRSLAIPDELADRDEVAFLHGRDLGELLSAERRATRSALLAAGVPVLDITLPKVDEASLGGLLMLLEAACALVGTTMEINPFDQPGVEAGKCMALGLLGRPGYESYAESVVAREALGKGL